MVDGAEMSHLTESQRSIIAGKLAKLKVGDVNSQREIDGVSIETPSIEQAADMLNVGRASVARAKQVRSNNLVSNCSSLFHL